MEAKIQWLQRVAGREEGHIETVELDTPFMQGALSNRRFRVIEPPKPPSPPAPLEPPKPLSPPSESDLMGLTKPKATPKPKAPAKGDGGVAPQGRTWV